MSEREQEILQTETPTEPEIDVPSEKFLQEFRKIVDALVQHKGEHNGYLPYAVFIETIRLAGQYPCIEILVVDPEGNLLLKRRDDPSELEWYGKLHIPGMTITDNLRHQNLIERLLKREIIKDGNEELVSQIAGGAKPLGLTWYAEPERRTTAFTASFLVEISDLSVLQDGFERATPADLEAVINQHKPTVGWYYQGSERPAIIAPPDYSLD